MAVSEPPHVPTETHHRAAKTGGSPADAAMVGGRHSRGTRCRCGGQTLLAGLVFVAALATFIMHEVRIRCCCSQLLPPSVPAAEGQLCPSFLRSMASELTPDARIATGRRAEKRHAPAALEPALGARSLGRRRWVED